MKYLTGTGYVAPVKVEPTISAAKKTAIKNKIKALVPKTSSKQMTDAEIVKSIQADYLDNNEHIHDSVIKECFDVVYLEYNPVVVSEEPK